ncbi:PREDICTED: uncharacterized protein LOC104800023, partial [Tarenaya hassleriana]|uniref:uncharacterized protein LOC104800023 n=1 Tax=Tarenaya hassleriana TaxID=28532 RepID=UPI00053C3480
MSFTDLEQHIDQMAREEDSPLESVRDMPRKDSDAKLQLVLDELTALKTKLANASFVSSTSTSGVQQGELALYAVDEGIEDVNYVANNPYSNTYNPGYRNHPNLSWRNNNVLNPPQNNYRPVQNQNQRIPPGFAFQPRAPPMQNQGPIQNQPYRPPVQNFRAPTPPLPQQDGDSEIKAMLAQLLQGQKTQETVLHSLKMDQEEVKNQVGSMQSQVDGMQSHLKLLDNQVAQMASTSQRPSGSLPGKPEINPREHCNAITLRSGKQLEEVTSPMMEKGQSSKGKEVVNEEAEEVYVPPPPRPPPIPFPSRLKKHNEDRQFARFAEMLKKLEITMPFTEAILQMPSYTKFLKDILTKKRVVEKETVSLNTECSALIQHEVGNFYVPVDFVVLDMDEDSRVPIILGRPFLNTADAVIHVRAGRLTMKIGDETVEFTLDQNLKQPSVMESSYFIDMIEVLTEEVFGQFQDRDPLKMMLLNPEKTDEEHIWTFSRILDAPDIPPMDLSRSPIQAILSSEGDTNLEIAVTNRAQESKETPVITSSPLSPDWSREDAPEVELKPLPQGL